MTKKTSNFKIAVIGAGASGLSASYKLNKLGFKVDIFEYSGGNKISKIFLIKKLKNMKIKLKKLLKKFNFKK